MISVPTAPVRFRLMGVTDFALSRLLARPGVPPKLSLESEDGSTHEVRKCVMDFDVDRNSYRCAVTTASGRSEFQIIALESQ